MNVEVMCYEDYMLYPIGYVINNSGKHYQKFTNYHNKAV